MKVKSIKGMRAGINKVVIKLNKFNDSVKFSDGTELYLETKYEPASHCQVIGTVAALPDRLVFDKTNLDKSMEHETNMELKVGDTAYMEYFGVMMALADRYDQASAYPDPKWFEYEGDLYIIIRYEEIYFVVRDKKIIPVNGYCIARPIHTSWEGDAIKPNEAVHDDKSNKWAEIIYVGEPCTDFVDPVYHDDGELEPGMCVLFGRWSNQRVEYDLHKTLFKEEGEYFVIQRKWMIVAMGAEMKSAIEGGKLK